MLKHKESDSTVACNSCIKNSSLIKKYEQLIHLYKKKQVRLSTEISSQISNGPTTCNTLDCLNIEIPSKRLILVLDLMYKRRCSPLFRMILPKGVKKLLMLSIWNKIQKYAKKEAFQKIKTPPSRNISQIQAILNRKLKNTLYNAFQQLNKNNRFSALQQIIGQFIIKPQQLHNKFINSFKDTKQMICAQNIPEKAVKRKYLQLEILNKKLMMENEVFKISLQELAKRQTKDNQKKKESLQMLAEQISQKNQQIIQLKNQLKAYEQTYQNSGNVLVEDKFSLRKDIYHLEQVRQKLNNQIEVFKSKLEQANKNVKIAEERAQKLQKQLSQIKNNQFQQNISHLKAQKMCTELSNLISSMNKKIKRLSIYQKQLQQSLILGDLHEIKPKQSEKVQQQLKSEIILMFLANISDPLYKLRFENLFDEEQKNALVQLKNQWFKLQTQEKQFLKIENKNKRLDLSEIEMQGAHGHMDSIFQALQSPRGFEKNQNSKSLTIRMLQLQIQKKKQVEKISQLKQKFLHIRIIILKLLKSFQLQQNLKTDTQDILRVLFDLFQYSEEQRESIFIRKKRMFSLF